MYIAQFSQLFTVTYRYITLNHGKLIFAYLYFCFLKTSTYENAVTFCERSANRLDTGADVTRLISSEMLLKCLCTQFVGKIRVYKACCNFSLTLRIYSFVLKSLQGTMALHSFVSVGIIGMMVSTWICLTFVLMSTHVPLRWLLAFLFVLSLYFFFLTKFPYTHSLPNTVTQLISARIRNQRNILLLLLLLNMITIKNYKAVWSQKGKV